MPKNTELQEQIAAMLEEKLGLKKGAVKVHAGGTVAADGTVTEMIATGDDDAAGAKESPDFATLIQQLMGGDDGIIPNGEPMTNEDIANAKDAILSSWDITAAQLVVKCQGAAEMHDKCKTKTQHSYWHALLSALDDIGTLRFGKKAWRLSVMDHHHAMEKASLDSL